MPNGVIFSKTVKLPHSLQFSTKEYVRQQNPCSRNNIDFPQNSGISEKLKDNEMIQKLDIYEEIKNC